MSDCYDLLYNYISELEIIDTHEHLPTFESGRNLDADILSEYLMHYYSRDLICAGLPKADFARAIDSSIPIEKRWKLVEPFWNMTRYTAYGRALDIAVKGLYGIDGINSGTIFEANERFKESLKPGTFKRVLKDKCNIRKSIINSSCDEWDRELFALSYTVNRFISPKSPDDFYDVCKNSGIGVTCFEDWLEAVETILDKLRKKGIASLKCSLAYERDLIFERTTEGEAERDFNNIFSRIFIPDWASYTISAGRNFQNYMMHFILRYCGRNDLPIQIHTGFHDGNGNRITNSDVSMLANLFIEYPDTRFDIFHISYPYQHVVGALAKTFPNVYIDMCWAHIISPSVCVRMLEEWIDVVPLNKICAFGGDYLFIDGVYANLLMTRDNMAKALANMIDNGIFGMDEAKWAARLWLHDNPSSIFKI